VIRSVRDIDNNRRRKFLYSIPLTANHDDNTKDSVPMIPPSELPDHVLLRLPSPSGQKIAVFVRGSGGGSDAATAGSSKDDDNKKKTTVLEIWVDGGQTLQRRIELPNKQHGSVLLDADTTSS